MSDEHTGSESYNPFDVDLPDDKPTTAHRPQPAPSAEPVKEAPAAEPLAARPTGNTPAPATRRAPIPEQFNNTFRRTRPTIPADPPAKGKPERTRRAKTAKPVPARDLAPEPKPAMTPQPEPAASKPSTTPEPAPRPAGATEPADGTATSPETVTTGADSDPTPVKGSKPIDFKSRRRRVTAIAAVALAGVFLLFQAQPWDAVTINAADRGRTATDVADATDVGAYDPIADDMEYAHAYFTENGTFDGLTLEGAQVAARAGSMYVARTINGACTAYGISGGAELAPQVDTTNAACTGQIVIIQAQLDEAASQVAQGQANDALSTLDFALRAAVAYASRTFENGVPTFHGLGTQVEGAVVVLNTGGSAVLRVEYPGACYEAFVTAAGQTGSPAPCS